MRFPDPSEVAGPASMRATWNELSRLGYVQFYGKRRARLVPGHKTSGLAIAAARANRPVQLG